MKYCCQNTKKRFKISKKFKTGILFLLLGITLLLFFVDGVVRSVISDYPMTVSSGVITKMMDAAMDEVLASTDALSSSIDKVNYDVNGKPLTVEANSADMIKIKTQFTSVFSSMLKKHGNIIKVSVPIGTLIGHEYTIGRGPKISFNLQFSCTVNTELKSSFFDAGVNNTLHTTALFVTNDIYIIIPWGHSSKSVCTKYIISETVIVGDVPDAFTNIHGADEEITDDIIDHGAKLN
ncbi:MAG: sporulation protein YunB [Clostridia bacterium]|nr:sporulation protein YunB [Clostridia bacterium]